MKKILLFWILLTFAPVSISAEKITLAADVWCPFNCIPGSEKPGFMVEVAEEIFSSHGYQVEYIEMHWPRAITEARKGNINAIIGAFRGDAPDFIFPDQELAQLGNTFFVRKETSWRYQGPDSLSKIQLGAIFGYDYGDELRGYIQHSNSSSVTILKGDGHLLNRGIKMLNIGRIDAIIEADPVFWFEASQLGLADQFTVAGRACEPMKSYIAFSPALDSSKKYAELLSTGLTKLRNNGKLDSIMARYGLKDWLR